MSLLADIEALVQAAGLTIYTGYAPTGATLPYSVHRPLLVDDLNIAINGEALDWDYQTTIYACAGSVEASFNLGLELMSAIQGKTASGSTLSTSMGYAGAPVEGHYESQVTVQINKGGLG